VEIAGGQLLISVKLSIITNCLTRMAKQSSTSSQAQDSGNPAGGQIKTRSLCYVFLFHYLMQTLSDEYLTLGHLKGFKPVPICVLQIARSPLSYAASILL
jgi:hypothetical protein